MTAKFSWTCVTERRTGNVSSDMLCGRQTSQGQTTRDLSHVPRQNEMEITIGTFTNG